MLHFFSCVYWQKKLSNARIPASYERRGGIHEPLQHHNRHRLCHRSNSCFPARRTDRPHFCYHHLLADFLKSWLQWRPQSFDVNPHRQPDNHHHVRLQRVADPARTQPAAPDVRRQAGRLPTTVSSPGPTIPAARPVWPARPVWTAPIRAIPTTIIARNVRPLSLMNVADRIGEEQRPASCRDKGRMWGWAVTWCLSSSPSDSLGFHDASPHDVSCHEDKHKAPASARPRPLSLQDDGTQASRWYTYLIRLPKFINPS